MLIKTDATVMNYGAEKLVNPILMFRTVKTLFKTARQKNCDYWISVYWGTNIYDNVLILNRLGNQPSRFSYAGMRLILDLILTRDKKIVTGGSKFLYSNASGESMMKSYIMKFDLNSPATPIWKIDNFDRISLYNSFACVTERDNGELVVGGFTDTMQAYNFSTNLLTRVTRIISLGNVLWNNYCN